jgi:hypothetical protein
MDVMSAIYTKEMLFEDLQTGLENGEKNCRNYIYQVKVLQTIFGLNVPELLVGEKKDNTNEIRRSIENFVEGDESLYGYTFYISSNYVYDYSWSYLRKQMSKYVDFLFNTNRFFIYVLRDLNALIEILAGREYIHVVFNEMIDVTFSDVVHPAKASMLWEKFHNIINVGGGYQLDLKLKEATLIAYNCSYKDNAEQLYKKIKEALSLIIE